MHLFDAVNQQAIDVLDHEDYLFIMDYVYSCGDNKHLFTCGPSESEEESEEESEDYTFHWTTTASGFRHKQYTTLPKYCIPGSDSESEDF